MENKKQNEITLEFLNAGGKKEDWFSVERFLNPLSFIFNDEPSTVASIQKELVSFEEKQQKQIIDHFTLFAKGNKLVTLNIASSVIDLTEGFEEGWEEKAIRLEIPFIKHCSLKKKQLAVIWAKAGIPKCFICKFYVYEYSVVMNYGWADKDYDADMIVVGNRTDWFWD